MGSRGRAGAGPLPSGHTGPCQLHLRSARVEAQQVTASKTLFLENTSLSFIIALGESRSGFLSSSCERGPVRSRSQGEF